MEVKFRTLGNNINERYGTKQLCHFDYLYYFNFVVEIK